jgi:hypothetical protein
MITSLTLILTIIVLVLSLILNFKVKERISPDPFRAALMEMAAAQNDPLSRYLYSFGA